MRGPGDEKLMSHKEPRKGRDGGPDWFLPFPLKINFRPLPLGGEGAPKSESWHYATNLTPQGAPFHNAWPAAGVFFSRGGPGEGVHAKLFAVSNNLGQNIS